METLLAAPIRVLVVDDDAANRALCSLTLARLGRRARLHPWASLSVAVLACGVRKSERLSPGACVQGFWLRNGVKSSIGAGKTIVVVGEDPSSSNVWR
jgi:hypothetical protein